MTYFCHGHRNVPFLRGAERFSRPERRKREFACSCARAATTKHMIEALGVPHTEVELVLVNGESVGFERLLEAWRPCGRLSQV